MIGAPLLLGIEIGGTKLQLGLGRGDGRILALERRAVVPEHGAEGIRAQIADAYDSLLARHGASRGDVGAAGIGFGGPLDAGRGVTFVSNQIAGWDHFPIVDWARRTLDIPTVSLQNDADTAALGEARHGAGVGMSPLMYVTIGSGIGGGLVIDGAIYRGAGAGALEIGHVLVPRPATIYGDTGLLPLEKVASGWAIGSVARRWCEREIEAGRDPGLLLQLAEGDPARITAALVAEAARRGHEAAFIYLHHAITALGTALGMAVTLLAPRRIILGGGVSLIGEERWIQPILRRARLAAFAPFRDTFDLVPASLGEEVVIHGSLALAREAATTRNTAPESA